MSYNTVVVITVAAAAATSILALHYLLCARRDSKKQQLSGSDKGSAETRRFSLQSSCCFPAVLRGGVSRRSSHSSGVTLSEPLLADGRKEKQHAMQDETCSDASMNQTGRNAADTSSSGLVCDEVPQSTARSTDSTSMTAGVSPESESSAQPTADGTTSTPVAADVLHEQSDASATAAVAIEASSTFVEESPDSQNLAPPVTPLDHPSSHTAAAIIAEAAATAAEQSVESFLSESTGTLISYPRPQSLRAKVSESSAALQPTPEVSSNDAAATPDSHTADQATADVSIEQPAPAPVPAVRKNTSGQHLLQTQAAVSDGAAKGRAAKAALQPATQSNTLVISSSAAQPSQPQEHSSPIPAGPHIELIVTLGPSKGASFTTTSTKSKVHIGRLPQCHLTVNDNEVSGSHCVVVYSGSEQCWKLADVGSLNGTHLNGQCVSKDNRKPGDLHVLKGENTIRLGTVTHITIKCVSAPFKESAKPPVAPVISDSQRHHLFRNKITFEPLRLEGCVVTKTGREHKRKATPSEDLVYFEAPFRQFQQAGLFCVFDGHNGRQAAELAKQFVPEEIVSNVNGSCALLVEGSRQEALEAAFLAADARLAADEGCTATAVVAERAEDGTVLLQIANVGDSAAVLVNPNSSSPGVKLTEDHRVVNPVERERLQQKGFKGTTRLFGLALSRSMGDKFLKDVDVGLIAKPYVSEVVSIKPDESGILVVASDGLWDVVTPERASKLVRMAMEESPGNVDYISERLLLFAVEHQSHDDITVMVLKFNPCEPQGTDSSQAS